MTIIKQLLFMVLGIVFFGGCASFNQIIHPLPPVTYEEVIRLTQENVPPETIIKKIQDSGTVFRLNSDEIVNLREQHVDASVVDYMMSTYIEAVRRRQELEDWHRWSFYSGHYYWWPDWEGHYHRIYRWHAPRP